MSFGALGYVIWGVHLLPVPKTFFSSSFLSYLSLFANCTLSKYLSRPAVPPAVYLPTLLDLLIFGLKVSSSFANSFCCFSLSACYCFFSLASRNFADLSAMEGPMLCHCWSGRNCCCREGLWLLNMCPVSIFIEFVATLFLWLDRAELNACGVKLSRFILNYK